MSPPKGSPKPLEAVRRDAAIERATRFRLAGNLNLARLENTRNTPFEKALVQHDRALRGAVAGQPQTTIQAVWDGEVRQGMSPFLVARPVPGGLLRYIQVLALARQEKGKADRGMRIGVKTPDGDMLLQRTTVVVWRPDTVEAPGHI
jgi:hypothetical protein